MLGTATALPLFACSLLVDVLDASSWAVPARAPPRRSRAVLGALWGHDADVTA